MADLLDLTPDDFKEAINATGEQHPLKALIAFFTISGVKPAWTVPTGELDFTLTGFGVTQNPRLGKHAVMQFLAGYYGQPGEGRYHEHGQVIAKGLANT